MPIKFVPPHVGHSRKCSSSKCRKGMKDGPIRINAGSIRYPSRQIGSMDHDYWPKESMTFCSVLCLNDAIREDMGVR